MTSKTDLHVHTNASDGKYSPAELVKLAAQSGLGLLAITDHDTVSGIAPALEAAKAFPDLRIIPGAEISSYAPGSEVHVLGYFIDIGNSELLIQLAALGDSRQDRARAIVEKLRGLGLDINLARVQEIAGDGSIGRPHIAQALMEKGYVSSFQEVFTKYIGQGGPAYVERAKLTPDEAVELIIKSGGLPVLAHPSTINNAEAVVSRLAGRGLVGLEAYYKDYTDEQRRDMVSLAYRYKLLATGGSDFHGIDEATEVMLGDAGVPRTCGENLIRLARERGLKLPAKFY
ncbi:MAG: PHP domain-containing protein [Dehalococcoidia bacterium]|nr:MAG: PHP domain-containing protein [Dehalococcoidia bacterium]